MMYMKAMTHSSMAPTARFQSSTMASSKARNGIRSSQVYVSR